MENVIDLEWNGEAHPEIRLAERDFLRLGSFIEGHCGIRMPPSKKVMLESRLHRRLRALGLSSFTQYCDFALGPDGAGEELIHLIDAVTTNKTEFFREPQHFECLAGRTLPTLLREEEAGIVRPLAVWSAGCSSGEEPYTVAMVLAEFAETVPGYRFSILGTDICTDVLTRARRAIYEEEKIDPIPLRMRGRYLLKSKDRSAGLVRIAPWLRARVHFQRRNFIDADYALRERMDVIFCRNVFIYFDRKTQEAILRRFCRCLSPGGYIFLGHSESICGLDVPLIQEAPTIYRMEGRPKSRTREK